MSERTILIRLFDQIIGGLDIPEPAKMLRISGKAASNRIENLPYSLITNLEHAVLWQDIWLDQLAGKPKMPSMQVWKGDWQVPSERSWQSVRESFLSGLEAARNIAKTEELTPERVDLLLRIAIHASYHLGQMNLLKRSNRA